MNELKLSANLIRLRREKKLTQKELADFIGVTKASVSKWENAQNTPDILLLPKLAAFFGVTVDQLIGYEPQLSREQIRRYYAQLCADFVNLPFNEALEKTRSLAHRYYACYPFLLQLSVLYCNHFMLAETEEGGRNILLEAISWCERILENCSDVAVCGHALALKAGLNLQLGKAREAIDALEPMAEPGHLTEGSGTILIQAYRMAGEGDKARSYAQVEQYLYLLNLIGNSTIQLSLYEKQLKRCEEIVRRIRDVMKIYGFEQLHPNAAAQFHYQTAITYGMNKKNVEALEALALFERCIDELLDADKIILHGDAYFDLLDQWIEGLPLGSMAPRDRYFILQSLQEGFSHPAFTCLKDDESFQKLIGRLSRKGECHD